MNDELVSRKAVIDFVCTFIDYNDDGEQMLEANPDIVILGLEELPSAHPERETGYLILLDNCSNSGYYCSACQKKLVKEGWSDTVKKIKFCPNCGVKLVGEQI